MIRNTVLVLPLLLMSAAAGVGEALAVDVDTAVQLAIENNLHMQSQQITLKSARRARKNSWNEFLPAIEASAAMTRSNQVAGTLGVTPSPWNLGLSVAASAPLSAAKVYSIRATLLRYEAGLIDYETAQRQLERDVRKSFYSLLLAQEGIRLAELELSTAHKRYQQILENYEAGLSPRLDVLSARVAAENLKPDLEARRVSYATALMRFRSLLGLETRTEIELQGAIEAKTYSFEADALAQRYLRGRLDIQSLVKQVETLENQKRLQKASSLTPVLSLSASTTPSLNDPFAADWGDADEWFDSGSVTVALSLALDAFIPGSATQTQLAELEDGIAKAQLSLEQALREARIEIKSAVLELEKSLRTMEALELNISLAQEAYDLTEKAYAAGTTELLEVQTASDGLQTAKLSLLDEKYNYLSSLIDLAYALNISLKEFEQTHD
ncbi:MAG: TolC family protein [Spirochaetales bacterium]|nr:TolC family protein [Spirochaetales bacterium]